VQMQELAKDSALSFARGYHSQHLAALSVPDLPPMQTRRSRPKVFSNVSRLRLALKKSGVPVE
jgi:hypothetical protein